MIKGKLTEHDRELIGKLKAERERLYREAKQLRDVDIARKFEVHENTVYRIPAWDNAIPTN